MKDADDVPSLVTSKAGLKHAGERSLAFAAVLQMHQSGRCGCTNFLVFVGNPRDHNCSTLSLTIVQTVPREASGFRGVVDFLENEE